MFLLSLSNLCMEGAKNVFLVMRVFSFLCTRLKNFMQNKRRHFDWRERLRYNHNILPHRLQYCVLKNMSIIRHFLHYVGTSCFLKRKNIFLIIKNIFWDKKLTISLWCGFIFLPLTTLPVSCGKCRTALVTKFKFCPASHFKTCVRAVVNGEFKFGFRY